MKHLAHLLVPNRPVSSSHYDAILVVWAALAVFTWMLYPSNLIPRPGDVVGAFVVLCSRDHLWAEVLSSYVTNITALAITTAISLSLSYLTVLPVLRPLGVFVSKLRFLGFTGLPFIFTLAFSTGHEVKIWMLVFGMSVFFVTAMTAVVSGVPREDLDHARTIGMSEWRVVWEVVVLGTWDQAIELIRQNAAMGWMMLTMVEGLTRAEGGVGILLLNQNKYLHLDGVIAIQITILIVGLFQDYMIGVLKRVVCPYASLRTVSR